jgi:lipopolysaccharide/colanic/teichoic acid biosynthesis glycosyltransferase
MLRCFDIILSCVALVLLSPALLPVMIVLRLTGEGEIFFKQRRIGLGGESFELIKFATMKKDSPSMAGGTITLKNDPRILPFGKFLRSTKLNELPQLINIIRGEMSLIGPRPQTQRCFDAFPIGSQKAISSVPPGLSGIGSLVFRNEDMMLQHDDADNFYDKVIMPYKGCLEEWYVSKRSVYLYLSLIFLTIWFVMFRRSNLIWKIFKTLPKPPHELHKYVGFNCLVKV